MRQTRTPGLAPLTLAVGFVSSLTLSVPQCAHLQTDQGGDSTSQGTRGSVWRKFCVSYLGTVPLAPHEWKPGMPLNILRSAGQPLTTERSLAHGGHLPACGVAAGTKGTWGQPRVPPTGEAATRQTPLLAPLPSRLRMPPCGGQLTGAPRVTCICPWLPPAGGAHTGSSELHGPVGL